MILRTRRTSRDPPPRLEDRGTYPTDAAAWQAVLDNPNLIIVDPAFLQQGGGPPNFQAKVGTKIVVADPFDGNQRTLTVAAIAPSDGYIRNAHFQRAHEAVRQAETWDQLKPVGIYFRVTMLPPEGVITGRGGAEDSHALNCMWADLDYGTIGHRQHVAVGQLPLGFLSLLLDRRRHR